MKVDDWLAKNIDQSNQGSSFSDWLHGARRSTSEQSSGCVTPTTSCDDFASSINAYNRLCKRQVDEDSTNGWLANEASLANNDATDGKQFLVDYEDDESLLDGLEAMNIGSNFVLDTDWLANTSSDRSSSNTGGYV